MQRTPNLSQKGLEHGKGGKPRKSGLSAWNVRP